MLNPLKVELRSLNISGDKSAAIMIHVWFVIQNFFGNGIKSNRNEAVSGLFHVGRCVCVTILSDLIRAVKFVRLFASEPESVAVFIKPKDFRTDSSKKKKYRIEHRHLPQWQEKFEAACSRFLEFLEFLQLVLSIDINLPFIFSLLFRGFDFLVLFPADCLQQTVCGGEEGGQ